MKQLKYIAYLVIVFCLIASMTPRHKSKRDSGLEKKEAERYVHFARLPYCDVSQLQQGNCPVCAHITEAGFKIVHSEGQNKDSINFNMVVSANDSGEVVVSFGGPKSENVSYLQQVYANGMTKVSELNNLEIQTEFWNVYSTFFRSHLIEQFEKLRSDLKRVVFVGHSFGGSVAQIAAYDLAVNNVIQKSAAVGPFIFTYGALKVGVHNFLTRVQGFLGVPMIRIRRGIDFFPLIPRCVFVLHLGVWRCYRSYVYLVRAFPMFAWYYLRFSPIIRRQLVSYIPNIVQAAKTYINAPVAKSGSQNVKAANAPQTHAIKQNVQTQKATPRHSEFSKLVKDHHEKKSDKGSFINKVSNMFKNHKNSVSQDRLANHSPLSYSGLGSNKETLKSNHGTGSDLQRNQNRAQEHLNNNLGSQHTSGPLGHHKTDSNSHSHKSFASHTPMKYSGLHSQSISNSRNINKRHSAQKKKKVPARRRKGRSFIETSSLVHRRNRSHRRSSSKQDFFKTCTTHGHYVTCKFLPLVHKVYFGVDMESCQ